MSIRFHLRFALAFVGLSILLAGCQNTVNTIGNTPPQNYPTPVDTTRISTDPFLADRVEVIRADVNASPGGMLKMQVTLQSMRLSWISQFWSWFTADNPYRLEYRITWLDDGGIAVGTIATQKWVPVDVYPGEIFYISGTAPTARCRDFRLSLRERD